MRLPANLQWGLAAGVFALLLALGCSGKSLLEGVGVVPADELPDTVVLPHTAGEIVAGRNYVYCSTFQLAWNELEQSVLEEPLVLEGSPPMAKMLGRGPKLSAEDLPPDGYFAKAGLVRDGVVQRIRKEMAARFPNADLSLPDSDDPEAIVAFACLEKSLPFKEAFDRLPDPLVFHGKVGDVRVMAWGVRLWGLKGKRDIALEDQVTVLDYAGPDDFVLRLNTTPDQDELVLAKVAPKETLAATVSAVIGRAEPRDVRDLSHRLGPAESLVVPVVSLGVWRRYEELLHRRLRNTGFEGLFLDAAEQGIRFRLDETGARLSSTAYLRAASKEPTKPREFIFDRPFLLFIRRMGSDHPYLALWIENADVLEPTNP